MNKVILLNEQINSSKKTMSRFLYALVNTIMKLCIIFFFAREIMLLIGLDKIASSLYELAIYLFIAYIILSFFNVNNSSVSLGMFILLLVTLLCGVLMIYNVWKLDGLVVSEHMKNTIGQILLLLFYFLFLTKIACYNKKNNHIYLFFNGVLAVCLIILAFFPSSYYYGALRYNYDNPNGAGLSILICSIGFLIGIGKSKTKLGKTASIALFLAMVALSVLSQARASILVMAIMFIVYFFKRKSYKKRINNLGFSVIYILLMMVPLIWVLFYKIAGEYNIVILGKPLFTGREKVWRYIISIVFNDLFKVHLGESVVYATGPHNVVLSLCWDYGIFVAIVYLIVLFCIVLKLINNVNSRRDLLIVSFFIGLLVHMCFENTLVSGCVNYMFRAFYYIFFVNVLDVKNLKQPKIGVINND